MTLRYGSSISFKKSQKVLPQRVSQKMLFSIRWSLVPARDLNEELRRKHKFERAPEQHTYQEA